MRALAVTGKKLNLIYMHHPIKYFFSFCLIAMVCLCSCDDKGESPASTINITIDNKQESYKVQIAEYSHIRRQFTVLMQNGSTVFGMVIDVDSPESLKVGEHSSQCDWILENLLYSTISTDATESILSITSIKPSASSYQISGHADNVVLTDFDGETQTVEHFEFDLSFTIPSKDDLDVITFEIGSDHYTYYGDNGSWYHDPYYFPNPDPNSVILTLTTNRGDDPSEYSTIFEGVTIIDKSPTYPPVPESTTGYSNGLRLYVTLPEIKGCTLSGSEVFFDGDNKQPYWESTTVNITEVTPTSAGYLLKGIFAGPVTNIYDEDDILFVTNGTFRITVPSL